MSDERRMNEDQANNGRKRGYVRPKLVCYGQVRDLTQNGAGSQVETKYTVFGATVCEWNRRERSCRSDRRVKQDLVRIGTHPLGIGLYLFDYKPEFRDACGHSRQFGVMAQEVGSVMPEAVCVDPDGYLMVDYAMLGISRQNH